MHVHEQHTQKNLYNGFCYNGMYRPSALKLITMHMAYCALSVRSTKVEYMC